MLKKGIMRCPICDDDEHIVDESELFWFLGCGHSIKKPEPEPEKVKSIRKER